MSTNNYETMMDVAAEIRDALQPRFFKVTKLGSDQEPVLINIANITAIDPAHSYSDAKKIVGTDITLNHAVGGDENGASVCIRVAESFEDIVRGLRRAVSIWYPMPPVKPLSEQNDAE